MYRRQGGLHLLDAGRFGLHVLSRHFLHPVDRVRQHDVT